MRISDWSSDVCSSDLAVMETPALALVGRHDAAGEQQFRSAALPDQTRQDRACPHVAASEANAGKQERGLRPRRRQPQIGCHGEDSAGTDAYPVQCADDGLRTSADRLRSEEHTSELQSLMRIPYAVFCLKQN